MIEQRPKQPPKSPLERQLLRLWKDLLGLKSIGVGESFTDLGGDPALTQVMLAEVEKLAHQRLPPDISPLTISTLARTILSTTTLGDDPVVAVQAGCKPPFLFCHGDYSTRGFYAWTLSRMLGSDQPVTLINPRRDFTQDASVSIEELAEDVLPRILAFHPEGPLRIGGYSIGGLLALELARRLTQHGRKVEFAVLIDSVSLNARLPIRTLHKTVSALVPLLPKQTRAGFDWNAMPMIWYTLSRMRTLDRRRILRALNRTLSVYRGTSAGRRRARPATAEQNLHASYFKMMCNYIPRKAGHPIFCLVAEASENNPIYAPAAWRNISSAVHADTVPGDHDTCITAWPDTLAEKLTALLAGEPLPRDNDSTAAHPVRQLEQRAHPSS